MQSSYDVDSFVGVVVFVIGCSWGCWQCWHKDCVLLGTKGLAASKNLFVVRGEARVFLGSAPFEFVFVSITKSLERIEGTFQACSMDDYPRQRHAGLEVELVGDGKKWREDCFRCRTRGRWVAEKGTLTAGSGSRCLECPSCRRYHHSRQLYFSKSFVSPFID